MYSLCFLLLSTIMLSSLQWCYSMILLITCSSGVASSPHVLRWLGVFILVTHNFSLYQMSAEKHKSHPTQQFLLLCQNFGLESGNVKDAQKKIPCLTCYVHDLLLQPTGHHLSLVTVNMLHLPSLPIFSYHDLMFLKSQTPNNLWTFKQLFY